MIRDFERVDLRRIKANKFSRAKDLYFVLDDPNFYKFTLVDNEADVVAIICFSAYWENNYVGFFLISEDMSAIHAREIKKFIYEVVVGDFQADRIQTDSVDCDELNKWHKFLGFQNEGKREKMIYNQDYNMWSILRGRDF